MRIGIDIDGVLTDLEKFQFDYGSKFAFEKCNKELVNANGYEIKEIYSISDEQCDDFWHRYFLDYVVNEPARKFADEVINILHNERHEIYVITARFFTDSDTARAGKTIEEVISKWLDHNNIYYDKLIFSPEEKVEICKENRIDLMIEDAPYNINSISSYIPVICYNAAYNMNCKGKNIYRCYSWYDIYSKIKKINKKEG